MYIKINGWYTTTYICMYVNMCGHIYTQIHTHTLKHFLGLQLISYIMYSFESVNWMCPITHILLITQRNNKVARVKQKVAGYVFPLLSTLHCNWLLQSHIAPLRNWHTNKTERGESLVARCYFPDCSQRGNLLCGRWHTIIFIYISFYIGIMNCKICSRFITFSPSRLLPRSEAGKEAMIKDGCGA